MAYSNEKHYDDEHLVRITNSIAIRRYAKLYSHRQRHPSASTILQVARRLRESVVSTQINTMLAIRIITQEHDLSYSTI